MIIDENNLEPMTTEELLDRIAPIRQDPVDREVYAAHYREKRLARWVIAALCILLVAQTVVISYLETRPVRYKYVTFAGDGSAHLELAEAGACEAYIPKPGHVTAALEEWAKLRYERLKPTIRKRFDDNYDFLSNDGIYQNIKQQDEKNQIVAKVLSGEMPENTIDVNAQLLRFHQEAIGGKLYWTGNAAIIFTKAYISARAPQEQWTVGVSFLVNPCSVHEQTSINPRFDHVNPIGLTITELPVENRTIAAK
jgi:type IV secretion system protein VirB5